MYLVLSWNKYFDFIFHIYRFDVLDDIDKSKPVESCVF